MPGVEEPPALPEWREENGGVEPACETAYVAKIEGEHPKYGLDRAFISESEGGAVTVSADKLARGDVVEIRYGEGNVDERRYVRVEDGETLEESDPLPEDNDAVLAAVKEGVSADVMALRSDIADRLEGLGKRELRQLQRCAQALAEDRDSPGDVATAGDDRREKLPSEAREAADMGMATLESLYKDMGADGVPTPAQAAARNATVMTAFTMLEDQE